MKITVQATVNAPQSVVWNAFTTPTDVMEWNAASDDWHCPAARNELRPGGRFCYTMAARDGIVTFDFDGTFDVVEPSSRLGYMLDDERRVDVTFEEHDGTTIVTEIFDDEMVNSPDLQQSGWQAILDRFKKHVEHK